MCDEDAILLEENVINQNTYKPGEEFHVTLQVNIDLIGYEEKI